MNEIYAKCIRCVDSACKPVIEYKVIALVKEGCEIRSIARLLGISTNAVVRKIQKTSQSISKPSIPIGKE